MNGWAHFLALFPEILAALLRGAMATLAITLGGLSVGVVWGLAVAFLRRSRNRVVTALGGIYVEVFRCVPVLVQLFIIYFGLGQIGLRLQPLTAAILGFGLNGAAYLAEVYRSGIEAVPAGQAEAAAAIGMTHRQAMLWIVLPQALKIALPPIGNYGIGLLKDSSIAVAVAAPEMTYAANALINETYLSTQIYLLLAVIYIAMSLPLSHLVRRLERRFRRGQPA